MITSFSTGGSFRSSNSGIEVVMVRMIMPTFCIWMKAFTRKRPMPAGLIAKLHSLVASNCAACLSFMTARASIAVCCEVRGCCDSGCILPSPFIAGGKPSVMNRSDPFFASIARSRS